MTSGTVTDSPDTVQKEHIKYWETLFSKDGKGSGTARTQNMKNNTIETIKR